MSSNKELSPLDPNYGKREKRIFLVITVILLLGISIVQAIHSTSTLKLIDENLSTISDKVSDTPAADTESDKETGKYISSGLDYTIYGRMNNSTTTVKATVLFQVDKEDYIEFITTKNNTIRLYPNGTCYIYDSEDNLFSVMQDVTLRRNSYPKSIEPSIDEAIKSSPNSIDYADNYYSIDEFYYKYPSAKDCIPYCPYCYCDYYDYCTDNCYGDSYCGSSYCDDCYYDNYAKNIDDDFVITNTYSGDDAMTIYPEDITGIDKGFLYPPTQKDDIYDIPIGFRLNVTPEGHLR